MGRHNGKKRRGGVGGGAGVTVVGDVVDVDGMGSTTLSSSLFSFLSLFFFFFHSIRFLPLSCFFLSYFFSHSFTQCTYAQRTSHAVIISIIIIVTVFLTDEYFKSCALKFFR